MPCLLFGIKIFEKDNSKNRKMSEKLFKSGAWLVKIVPGIFDYVCIGPE